MGNKDEFKKEILLDSFNILKENIYKNSKELANIILRMLEFDINLAIEMWSYLLKEFTQIGEYGNETYALTSGMIYEMNNLIGREKVAELVFDNELIIRKVFNEAACPDDIVVGFFIDTKDFYKANLLLDKVYSNSNHDTWGRDKDAFGYYINEMLKYYCKNITKESVDFILEWAEKASNENKAKIRIKLLDYI